MLRKSQDSQLYITLKTDFEAVSTFENSTYPKFAWHVPFNSHLATIKQFVSYNYRSYHDDP